MSTKSPGDVLASQSLRSTVLILASFLLESLPQSESRDCSWISNAVKRHSQGRHCFVHVTSKSVAKFWMLFSLTASRSGKLSEGLAPSSRFTDVVPHIPHLYLWSPNPFQSTVGLKIFAFYSSNSFTNRVEVGIKLPMHVRRLPSETIRSVKKKTKTFFLLYSSP